MTETDGQLDADQPDRRGRYRIQAIERAVAILNAFTVEQPEYGVTELANELGLHKSTTHRFLVNLEHAGLVERNPRTGRYRLGLHILELSGVVTQQMSLWEEALPFLEGLVRDTGETGHLAVLDNGEAVYVERVETHRALRIPSAVGRGYPAHATSLGKVLLAHLGADEVDEIITTQGLESHTPHTITDATDLHDELAMIRERGYAVDNEEYDEGLCCIGAPIRDHTGAIVAALGVGGPVTRVTPERLSELSELVSQAATGLSRRLGAHQSAAYSAAALRIRTRTDRALPAAPAAV